ncbi:MAG: hypothetical protein ACSLE8_14265 [Rhodococcus sp. (in: high G+C Gram-positive bacteria)]
MKKAILLCMLTALVSVTLSAQPAALNYGEDYTTSDEITAVTTVKVAPNRIDHYLAGLKSSWIPAAEIGKEMGLAKDFAIYVSELTESGDFNVVLVTTFENAAQRQKAADPKLATEYRRRVEQKMSQQESFKVTEGYTKIRDITGEYLLRKVAIK